MMILFALAIFFSFAFVGGLVVFLIVRNERNGGPHDLPPRGVPWDSPENRE